MIHVIFKLLKLFSLEVNMPFAFDIMAVIQDPILTEIYQNVTEHFEFVMLHHPPHFIDHIFNQFSQRTLFIKVRNYLRTFIVFEEFKLDMQFIFYLIIKMDFGLIT